MAVLQQLINALSLGGTYALLALGLALVFSVLGLINFAHGTLMTVTGYAMVLALRLGWGFGPAVVLGIACAAISAILMERLAFRPLRDASVEIMLVSSFAVAVILEAIFQNAISARPLPVHVPEDLNGFVSIGGLRVGRVQVMSIVASILLLASATAFLRRSSIGLAMRAAAEDFPTTRLMGVKANAVISYAFAASGIAAGVAGVLWVSQRGTVDPFMGLIPVLKAFVAAVLGGLGNLTGAVLGGFLLGFVEVAMRSYLPTGALVYADGLTFAVVMAVLLVRPEGILSVPSAVRS